MHAYFSKRPKAATFGIAMMATVAGGVFGHVIGNTRVEKGDRIVEMTCRSISLSQPEDVLRPEGMVRVQKVTCHKLH
jgi:hypothetical protein